ncbi:MAG: HAD family hydrolase [Anaerolineales bacterium]|jgi:HAD superfamily hydrolase (TIGR01549 family)|nr:HAD family hydrolase [Anaerolineales bacterium]
MQNIRAILFDLGNTLIYFEGEWPVVLDEARRAALHALHQAGLPVEMTPFLSIFRETLENHYTRREDDLLERTTLTLLRDALTALNYGHVSERVLDTARRAFYAITQAHWLPEPDALPTLQTLCQQGYRLGLISNAADDWDVQTLVDKAKIRPYLDFVITSAAFGQRKPAPDIFHTALATWHLPPARVAMVGDTLNADILGANRAGLCSVWLTRRVKTPPAIPLEGAYQPDRIIPSLAALSAALASLE